MNGIPQSGRIAAVVIILVAGIGLVAAMFTGAGTETGSTAVARSDGAGSAPLESMANRSPRST